MYYTSIPIIKLDNTYVTATIHIRPMNDPDYFIVEVGFCGHIIAKQHVVTIDIEEAKMNGLLLLSLELTKRIKEYKDQMVYTQNELAEYEAFLKELQRDNNPSV
jgi:hypothetical protein